MVSKRSRTWGAPFQRMPVVSGSSSPFDGGQADGFLARLQADRKSEQRFNLRLGQIVAQEQHQPRALLQALVQGWQIGGGAVNNNYLRLGWLIDQDDASILVSNLQRRVHTALFCRRSCVVDMRGFWLGSAWLGCLASPQ